MGNRFSDEGLILVPQSTSCFTTKRVNYILVWYDGYALSLYTYAQRQVCQGSMLNQATLRGA